MYFLKLGIYHTTYPPAQMLATGNERFRVVSAELMRDGDLPSDSSPHSANNEERESEGNNIPDTDVCHRF